QTVNALCPGTTYYVRAYATNSAGTSYGATETFSTTANAGDIWIQKANFGGGTREGTVGFSIGTKGYFGIGESNAAIKQDFWEYDPTTDVWTQKANFGGGGRQSAVGFSIGTKGYVGTGGNGTYYNDFWEYDPSTNVWTSKATFGGVARAYAVGFSIGSKGYIGTGIDNSTNKLQDFWEYNPSGNTWTQKTNFPGVGRFNAGGFNIGTKGYIGVGLDGSTDLKDFYEYDQSSNLWTQKADYLGGVNELSVGLSIGNKGYFGIGTSSLKELYEYDPTQNFWIRKTDFPGTGRWFGAGFSIGNKGYIGTGILQGPNTYYQDFYEYTPNTIPQFISGSAGSITSSGAVISATYDANYNGCSSSAITDHGLVWHTATAPTTGTNTGTVSAGAGTSTISHTITGLSANTTYYVRSYSTSAQGTRYGNEVSFTTSAGAPTVTTTAISNILSTTADGGGNVTANNGAVVTARGVVWDISTSPTIALSTKTSDGTGNGAFTSSITGLSPGTTYYVRAYATNSAGTAYGSEVSFTTLAVPPTLSTTAISSIGTTTASSGGNITASGGASVTARGVVWDIVTSPSTTLSTKTSDGTGTGIFTSSITGLTPGTTYYVRAYATNSAGTSYGNEVSFSALPDIPTLTTTAISSITSSAASSGGNITANNGAAVTARGVVWDIATSPTIALSTKTSDGSGNGAFASSITGLSPGTTYYVRAYATNSAGTAYGSEVSFTTLAVPPTLTTTAISAITTISATSGGNISASGGASVTARGVVWDIATSPTIALATKTSDGTGIGVFVSSITGLTPGTTYYVRAYATNSAGTSYGNEVSFSALPDVPTLTTTAISSILNTTASSGGNITNNNGAAVTARGVVWDIASSPTIALATKTSDGTGNGAFTSSITGLSPGTTYYVRAYATNSAGTAYGSEVSFTTLAVPPTLSTTAISSIGTTTASSGGNITASGGASVTVRGVVWDVATSPTTALATKTSDGTGTGIYTSSITGLTHYTTYYVRSYATNSAGTAYGNEVSFTTLADLPTITTSAISNITINSASGGGTVSSDGGAAVTSYGLVWSETATPTISSNRGISNDGSGTGAFTSSITSLDDGTLFYARAYATNIAGTAYGNTTSFTTLALPTIADSSQPFTNVTNSTVKVSGRIVSFGDGGLIEQGFAWATHSGVTTSDTKALSSNIAIGPVSFTVRNLPIASQIYFVQFVTTSLGTVYGEEFEIRTLNYTDTDGDGISDEVEQAGGNNGDSNRDGIPDYLQGGVTTVATNLPVGSNSANSLSPSGVNYITVQALGCNSISDVFTNKNLVDKNYHYPVGIVEFKVPCGTARVKIYYHNYRSLQGYVYRKLNQYGNWITYSGAVFGTENFNGKQVATVILDLKDGSNGDSDGLTDGVITDPGGPALLIEPAIIPVWDWKYVVLLMSLFGFWIYKSKIL
ncbi:MAG: hypothetical protein NTW25_07510, partial [Candidatus Kapabacteria bacterium]|nr:hypothetical protein [Candidatus Kapabacteria bacterium]